MYETDIETHFPYERIKNVINNPNIQMIGTFNH